MNWKVLALAAVLADFVGLTTWALHRHGYLGLFEVAFATPAGIQVVADLAVALSLVSIWMWRDARERGIAFLPFALLTATLGSIGPLCYLLRRELGEARKPLPAAARAAAR